MGQLALPTGRTGTTFGRQRHLRQQHRSPSRSVIERRKLKAARVVTKFGLPSLIATVRQRLCS